MSSYPLNLQSLTLEKSSNGSTYFYNYKITLPNRALIYVSFLEVLITLLFLLSLSTSCFVLTTVLLTISVFQDPADIAFAGQTVHVGQNGVKYSMRITSWPFLTISNRLLISMRAGAQSKNGNKCQTSDTTKDTSNNLRTIMVGLNGVTLYPWRYFF